jgi:hypothetical protein
MVLSFVSDHLFIYKSYKLYWEAQADKNSSELEDTLGHSFLALEMYPVLSSTKL